MKVVHPFEAILSLYASGYRQKHECTCGPSSLALAGMALTSELRPENDWYSEKLRRWMPIDQFLTRGLALHEAQFTTEFIFSSKVEVILRRAFDSNESEFIKDLETTLNRQDQAVVVNFTQDYALDRPFQAQGEPHYSVVAGFDLASKQVLLADVDPEIERPYQISVERLFRSMTFINPAFGVPRGWLVLKRQESK